MIAHMQNVDSDVAIYQVSNANVLRTPYVPSEETGGIGVDAAERQSARGRRHLAGRRATSSAPSSERYPEVVLGAQAAETLRSSSAGGHVMVYLGNTWFNVVGIMKPAILDPTLDTTVFIGLPVAERLFQLLPNAVRDLRPRELRTTSTQVANLLAPTADPQNADGVDVNRPSDVLEARAAAKGQFTTLLLGLGAVALLVGAIGIANIMVISVLERRGEIGLRRALGATRRHISAPVPDRVGAARRDRRRHRAVIRGGRDLGLLARPRTSRSSSRPAR